MVKASLKSRFKTMRIRLEAAQKPSQKNILKRTGASIARIREVNKNFPDRVERVAGAVVEGLVPAQGFTVVKLRTKPNPEKLNVLRAEEQVILSKAIRRAFVALAIPNSKRKECSDYLRQIFSWSSHSSNVPTERVLAHRQMERIGQQLEKLIGKRKTNWFIRLAIRNHAAYMEKVAEETKQELRIANT